MTIQSWFEKRKQAQDARKALEAKIEDDGFRVCGQNVFTVQLNCLKKIWKTTTWFAQSVTTISE